jgi:predicted MFS family arabinose efflux permease
MIDKFGIPWTFRVFGLLIIATGLPTALLLKEHTVPGQTSRFDWSLLKNVPFLALAMGGAIGVFALFVPPFFLPLFANSIELSGSTGAALVAGFGGATAAGRLASGWTCDRIGAFNTLAVSAFVNSLTMLAIWPVSSSLAPLLIFAIVNGVANGSFFVALPTAVAALTPGSAASSISMAVTFWTPGYLLGSPIAGMLIQATGAEESTSIESYRAAIFYAAGTGMIATFLIIFSRVKQDRKLLKRL